MRTLLVFAYACAPYHRAESTIGAQRPASFAKYLPRFGWRAIVLCADARASDPPSDRELDARVLAGLESAGLNDSVIIPLPAMRSNGALDRVWRRVAAKKGGLWSVTRKPLTLAKFLTGDYSQNWQPSARHAARTIAAHADVDACLGEHSPDAGIFLAKWFARRYRVPWVADFRDPMLFGHPAYLRPVLAPIARRRLRSAARIVNVTPSFVAIDSRMLRRSVTLIPNGFDPEEFAGPVPARTAGRFLMVLSGSVWVPSHIDLFLSGLRGLVDRLGEDAAPIQFQYIGDAAPIVRDAVARWGLQSHVEARGRVPRDEALALVRSADLLVILTPAGFADPYWDAGGYPGKIFEYFGARRSILAVPGDRGVLDDLLKRTRTGVTASSPTEITARLGEALRDWRLRGRVCYDPDPDELAEFTRPRAAERLAAVLNDVVYPPLMKERSTIAPFGTPRSRDTRNRKRFIAGGEILHHSVLCRG